MRTQTPRQKPTDSSHRQPGIAACTLTIVLLVGVTVCSLDKCRAQSATDDSKLVEPQLLALRDPELSMPQPVRRLLESFFTLWIEALAGPEYELKRDVAMSITHAHREGYRDCSAAADALIETLNDDSTPRSVLVEVARALSTIEAKSSSAKLKELLKKGTGTHFERVAELTLARWGDAGMLALWQKRLTADDVLRHRRLLAIQAIAALPETMTNNAKLQSTLESVVESSSDNTVRLEAARTLGTVKREGLEPLAAQLARSPGETNYPATLASVYVLLRHESESSQTQLLSVITNSLADPRRAPIVRAAWSRLLQQNVSALASLAPRAIRHSDPEVRRNAIETLNSFPTNERVTLLGTALDDRHPDIRRAARQALLTLSRDESLISSVRQSGLDAIARSSWKEQEQAIILLAVLDQSDAADRMMQLLSSPRAEVAIAAAWGLRKLNVTEKLPTLLNFARKIDNQIENGLAMKPHESVVLAHIFEAFGRAEYQPSVPLLRRWIPKNAPRVNHDETRASAFWSVGRLFEDSKDVSVAQEVKARFTDVSSLVPESSTVRYAAGISLGRIGATEVAPDLKRFALMKNDEPDLAAAWSLERLTGEVIPPPTASIVGGARWKLIPVGSRRESATTDQQSR